MYFYLKQTKLTHKSNTGGNTVDDMWVTFKGHWLVLAMLAFCKQVIN